MTHEPSSLLNFTDARVRAMHLCVMLLKALTQNADSLSLTEEYTFLSFYKILLPTYIDEYSGHITAEIAQVQDFSWEALEYFSSNDRTK